MTWDVPTLPGLRFVRERPCPYLPGRVERTLAAPLPPLRASEVLDAACRAGFRRSQNYVYRPSCRGCAECVPVRVPVAAFAWRRHWRRVVNANADLISERTTPKADSDAYELFHRYQIDRHGPEGMGAMTYSDFRAMVEDSPAPTSLIQHRTASGCLAAALLADRVADGWSAVYSFFDPSQPRRSLGNYMILDLIRRSAEEGLPFVYLGYWIARSAKMAYKARFAPLEAMGPSGWQPIHSAPQIAS
ncbi:MAG TPA: arginyltransferase [Thermomicrobiales bacterium]|nr:arginyltransferase [Thermomicrobiales bacterium]